MTKTIPPTWDDVPLIDAHVEELKASAITPEIALEHGVYSITDPDANDLPEGLDWVTGKPDAYPLLVHPLRDVRGMTVFQVKPAPGSVTDADGKELKYVSEPGDRAPVMFARKEVEDPEYVLLVEGTKQSMAVAAWAPDNMSVYGFPGITGWSRKDKLPSWLAKIVRDRHVIIVPDADAATNRMVYNGAKKLGDVAKGYHADSVHYVRLPAIGTAGIDDVLADLDEDERTDFVKSMVRKAERTPADKRPPGKRGSDKTIRTTGPRPTIPINPEDIKETVDALLGILKGVGDLYYRNGKLVQVYRESGDTAQGDVPEDAAQATLRDGIAQARTVTEGVLQQIMAEHARVVHSGKDSDRGVLLPSQLANTLLAYAHEFPPLRGIVTNPIYTSDLRLIVEPGYDKGTGLYLDLDPALEGIAAPTPTAESIAKVRELFAYWLQDFPFEAAADYANYIAFLLTPLLRHLFSKVPAFALNANGMGSGKSLLAGLASRVLNGQDIETNPFPPTEEEATKVLIAMLIAGRTLTFFDETPEVNSRTLNGFLTAPTYSGRILGESTHSRWKNNMTVVIAGNNVKIEGDLRRRFFMSTLKTDDPNPANRDGFVIKDIEGWTDENRLRLLSGLLEMVKWWEMHGCPDPSNPPLRLGGFEKWQNTISGILECAGIHGHLDNVMKMRRESDETTKQTNTHLRFALEESKGEKFTAGLIQTRIEHSIGEKRLPNLDKRDDAATLGKAYSKIQDIWFEDLRIVNKGRGAGGVTQWQIEVYKGAQGGGPGDDSGDDPTTPIGPPPPPPAEPTPPDQPVTSADVSPAWRVSSAPIVKLDYADKAGRRVPDLVDIDEGCVRPVLFFDLETCDADDLYTHSGPGFVRLAAWAVDDGEVHTTTDISLFANLLHGFTAAGGLVCAHNAVSFDLAALHRHHGLNVDWMIEHGRVRDTLLMARQTDPPGSGNADARRYGLDALATRLLDAEKLASDGQSALKKLKDEHGGYGAIPVDDPTYVAYAKQDVELLRGIFRYLKCDAYVLDEHCRLWALTHISREGWCVDVAGVEGQVEADEAAKQQREVQLREHLESVTDTTITGSAHRSKAGKVAFATALEHYGVATSDIPVTKTGATSTKAELLEELAEKYPDNTSVGRLCETAIALVSQRTTPNTVLENTHRDGRVHPDISASQATGRISVTRPGLTVMGARKRKNLMERRFLLPDSVDHVLIACDLSGIDGRAMAVMSQDPKYMAGFAPGVDVHTQTARDLFGDESRRSDAKVINHGLNYGMGARLLAENLGVDVVEADSLLKRIRLTYPELESFKERARAQVEATGLILTPAGRWVRVSPDRAYTQAPAALGQGLARDLLMAGILRLPAWLQPQLRGIIHDEIVLSVPADRVDEARAAVRAALQFEYRLPGSPQSMPVQILAEVSSAGGDWAECYADDHPDWPEIRRDHRALPDCDDMECSWHHHELDRVEEASQ